MKKNKKVYFLDFDQQIEKKNLSDKYFYLMNLKIIKEISYILKRFIKKKKVSKKIIKRYFNLSKFNFKKNKR